jgi:hypothetical protein
VGSRRLLGRRVRNQAACRSSSGLSSGSESRDRIVSHCECVTAKAGPPTVKMGHNRECSEHANRVSRPPDRTIRVRCSELTLCAS